MFKKVISKIKQRYNNDVILDKNNKKLLVISKGIQKEYDIRTVETSFGVKDIRNSKYGMEFYCYEKGNISNNSKCIFKNKNKIAYIRELRKELDEFKKEVKEEEKKQHFDKIFKSNTVKIIHPNGKIEEVDDNLILDMEDYVLYSEGGKTYHKCTGCFKKWGTIYKENFKNWQLISIQEAKQKGLKLCNYCDEAQKDNYNFIFGDNEDIE